MNSASGTSQLAAWMHFSLASMTQTSMYASRQMPREGTLEAAELQRAHAVHVGGEGVEKVLVHQQVEVEMRQRGFGFGVAKSRP
jgi:hypothetical protein